MSRPQEAAAEAPGEARSSTRTPTLFASSFSAPPRGPNQKMFAPGCHLGICPTSLPDKASAYRLHAGHVGIQFLPASRPCVKGLRYQYFVVSACLAMAFVLAKGWCDQSFLLPAGLRIASPIMDLTVLGLLISGKMSDRMPEYMSDRTSD